MISTWREKNAERKKTGKKKVYFQVHKMSDMLVFFLMFFLSFKFSTRKLKIQLHNNLKLKANCIPTTILGDSTHFCNLILTITLYFSDAATEIQKCPQNHRSSKTSIQTLGLVEKLNPSFIANGNIKWCSCFGK